MVSTAAHSTMVIGSILGFRRSCVEFAYFQCFWFFFDSGMYGLIVHPKTKHILNVIIVRKTTNEHR